VLLAFDATAIRQFRLGRRRWSVPSHHLIRQYADLFSIEKE
jgi:hypothetical protein